MTDPQKPGLEARVVALEARVAALERDSLPSIVEEYARKNPAWVATLRRDTR